MIILDTNVVSEPIKPNPDPAVLAWLDRQMAESLFLTSVSLAELLVGVETLPEGRRKQHLRAALSEFISNLFGARILPFDPRAAQLYAARIGLAKAGGKAIGFADSQIACIAAAHGFSVATRDVEPFRAAGVRVINPWDQKG